MQALISGFSGQVERGTASKAPYGTARRLRSGQEEVFRQLVGQPYLILNSPTGWGKTTTLIFLAARQLLDDPKSKVVITVPQRIIGGGFSRKQRIEMPEGQRCDWTPLDLCENSPSKVVRFMKWLRTPGDELDRQAVVTTHASLVAALARTELSSITKGTTVVIDEGHHVQASDTEMEGYNRLGSAIGSLIDLDTPVWLATAFFFRGDKLPILGQRHLSRFKRVFVPFDAHFKAMEHLRSYSYDFVAYRQSIFPDLERLLRLTPVPTLIYCPPEGHALLQGKSKAAFVQQVISLVRRSKPDCRLWSPEMRGSERNVVVDLVDLNDREQKVRYIQSHGDRIIAILTVGMMQEGADWPSCARVIDLVPSASDQTRNQKFGRLIRDFPGKEHIHYYSFLPFMLSKGEDDQRRTFSKIFAHLHASLILENALKPVKMPVEKRPPSDPRTTDGGDGESTEYVDLLGLFDEQRQRQIEEEVSQALVNLAGTLDKPLAWDLAGPAIDGVLKKLGCTEVVGEDNLPALRDQIVLLWKRRRQPNLVVDDLIRSGFDKIWASDVLDPIKMFSAGVCGVSTFSELREILGTTGEQDAEEWARRCAARYLPGSLPSQASNDPTEREDALKIAHFRMYKKGKKNGNFYPSVERIFEEAGHLGIFETTDFQTEAEEWARECAARYEPGCLPAQKSRDPQERHDGLKIANMQRAKYGEGTCIYYPSVEVIFKQAGHKGVFSKVDRQREAEEWAEGCARRYKPGELPSEKSPDPVQRRDGKKITHLRAAKRGKGQGTFYPTVEAIFEKAGHRKVFG